MRIIDEKGRIFGKVNVIDFLVIVFLFCLMPMFYFGYKIFTTKADDVVSVPKVEIIIEINCRFIKVKPEVLKVISIGDKELDFDGDVIGEILHFGKDEPYKYELNVGGGQRIAKEDPILKQIDAKLKLKTEVKEDKLYYKNEVIEIGSPLEFKTDKYTIFAIPKLEKLEKVKRLDLYVILRELDDDMLKLVSVGDKALGKTGEVIAEILSVGKINNDTREIDLGGGNFVLGEDSSKKQVSAKMRLKCKIGEEGKYLYFEGKRVEYNSLIEFKTDKYTAAAMIAKAYEATLSPLKEKWLSLQVKFLGVIPEVAKAIADGDIEKDATGKTAARLRTIISNKPSEVLTLRDNMFITLNHPFQKDVMVNLDVRCIEKDGILYFKNYSVKMGNMITFTTELYSISGTIVGVETR